MYYIISSCLKIVYLYLYILSLKYIFLNLISCWNVLGFVSCYIILFDVMFYYVVLLFTLLYCIHIFVIILNCMMISFCSIVYYTNMLLNPIILYISY